MVDLHLCQSRYLGLFYVLVIKRLARRSARKSNGLRTDFGGFFNVTCGYISLSVAVLTVL